MWSWTTVVGCALGYGVTSSVLLRFPRLVPWNVDRHRPPAYRQCTHISHRGGAAENIENTMQAFRHAVACGTEMLELDCQRTRDGKIVVAHDRTLLRLAGVDQLIRDTDYADLPQLCVDQRLDFDKSVTVTHSSADVDRRIPLLRDVFDAFPKTNINVDVKDGTEEIIDQIGDLIVAHGRERRTSWGHFSAEICGHCRAKNPTIPYIFGWQRCVQLILAYHVGLLPFLRIDERCFECIMPTILLDHPHAHITPHGWRRLLVHVVDYLIMSPKFFAHLRRRGVHVYLWVLNSEAEWERAFGMGVSGVMTDYPRKLDEWLKKHPHYDRRVGEGEEEHDRL